MSRNPPLFGGVLSAEEHVLGCMCDLFRSWAEKKETIFSVSTISTSEENGIEGGSSVHYLKKMDLPYPSIVYEIYGFHWRKSNLGI